MQLREFFTAEGINLALKGRTKNDLLRELVELLHLDDKSQGMLLKMLQRREASAPPASAGGSPSPTAAPWW